MRDSASSNACRQQMLDHIAVVYPAGNKRMDKSI